MERLMTDLDEISIEDLIKRCEFVGVDVRKTLIDAAINKLKSVEYVPVTRACWIATSGMTVNAEDPDNVCALPVECSNCGSPIGIKPGNAKYANYCPVCGAKMETGSKRIKERVFERQNFCKITASLLEKNPISPISPGGDE